MYSKDGYKRNSKDKNNPYNTIPSGNITMKDVDFPVKGTDNLGNSKIMMPGADYTFPGNEVFEVPLQHFPRHFQEGGSPHIGASKARIAYESHFRNNPAINRLMSGTDDPYVYTKEDEEKYPGMDLVGSTGTHFMGSHDNYAVPHIQDVDGKLELTGPRIDEAIRFDNPETAAWFAENYKQFAPKGIFQEGGEEESWKDKGIVGPYSYNDALEALAKLKNTREYWKDKEAMDRSFLDDWYLTGDKAYKDEDGYYWFVGRADDVIISAGYRIGPFEVESALIEHPAVAESAVVASPDPVRGDIVKAFVILAPDYVASDELVVSLQDHVRTTTAPYKYPRSVEFVTELPKTVSGKIRRVELRQQEVDRAGGSA